MERIHLVGNLCFVSGGSRFGMLGHIKKLWSSFPCGSGSGQGL